MGSTRETLQTLQIIGVRCCGVSKKKKIINVAERANRLLCVISISANNFFSYRHMTCKQDPLLLGSATGLYIFSFSRHRNSERQLVEVSQICNVWLGQFCQNFHACFNPGQSSYQHLTRYEFLCIFLCLNSVNILVVIPRTPPLVQCCRYHSHRPSLFINIV